MRHFLSHDKFTVDSGIGGPAAHGKIIGRSNNIFAAYFPTSEYEI